MRAMIFALSLLLLPVAACESTASTPSADLADAIEGRIWRAVSFDGQPVIAGTSITLKVDNGRVSGKGGCNGYGGSAEIRGDAVKFSAIFSTKMACMADGVMHQEQHYFDVLQGATRGELRGDTLVLSGERGTLEFRGE
jgi:heat shock protein HslJ